jgi:hypothetical protein
MRTHELAQHAVGFLIGLAIAAVAIDFGRQHAPRSTAPVLSVQLSQD